jgi:hypothetical protein
MRCPFCGHKQQGNAFCLGCQAGLEGLTEGQMTLLKEKLREAKRNANGLALASAVLLGLGVLSVTSMDSLIWTILAFFFMAIASVFWFVMVFEQRDLEWFLAWWGRQRKQ